MSLHQACYAGQLDVVRALLDAGADPNEPSDDKAWISAATRPRPLNCVAIAWGMTEDHVQIARLLIERGARVDETMITDLTVESMGGLNDAALMDLLKEHQQT
jgi:ankyrin repeat protein